MIHSVISGVIIDIVERLLLRLTVKGGVSLCCLIRQSCPSARRTEECFSPPRRMPGASDSHPRHFPGSECPSALARISRVGIHPREEQIIPLIVVIIIDSSVIRVVIISQMQLPVESQLYRLAGRPSDGTGSYLFGKRPRN